MKRVYLTGNGGVYAGSDIPVDNELIIGRDPKICQLVYPGSDRGISGIHCKVQNNNGIVTVTDLGSTNGTFLRSGEKLSPNTPYTLQSGQGFYLGDKSNVFVIRMEETAVPQVMNSAPMQPAGGVLSQPAIVQPKQNKGSVGIIVAVVVVVVGIIAVIAIGNVNSARQAAQQAEWEAQRMEQELYEEQNKGVLEKTVDTVDDWLDIIFK